MYFASQLERGINGMRDASHISICFAGCQKVSAGLRACRPRWAASLRLTNAGVDHSREVDCHDLTWGAEAGQGQICRELRSTSGCWCDSRSRAADQRCRCLSADSQSTLHSRSWSQCTATSEANFVVVQSAENKLLMTCTVATELTVVEAALLFCCVPDAEAPELTVSLVTAPAVCRRWRVACVCNLHVTLLVKAATIRSTTAVRPMVVGMPSNVDIPSVHPSLSKARKESSRLQVPTRASTWCTFAALQKAYALLDREIRFENDVI